MTEVIIGIAVGVVIALVVVLLLKSKLFPKPEDMDKTVSDSVEARMRELMPELMKSANEQLVLLADQKLGSEKKEIKTDLENKRAELERLVKTIQDDLKLSKDELNKSERDRIGSFNALKSALEEYQKITSKLSSNTENLHKLLSNNQLRGQFGEQVADDLLRMAGFVKDQDYVFNKEQAGSETRPDFSINLPDGKTKINVDSKFPYVNLQRMTETDSPEEKQKYFKLFEQDVKAKIKQVATRDYINPDDNTVDFAIIFIPNEMIFSFIYDKLNEVWTEAMNKKVIFAGPFSFTAILRLVRQAYSNFKYQENIREVIQSVQMFEKEFDKFSEAFKIVGTRLDSAKKAFDEVDSTRTNVLSKQMQKVTLNAPEGTKGTDTQVKLLED